jgi:ribosome-associated protein
MANEEVNETTKQGAPADSEELAMLSASFLEDRKAENLVILKMDEVMPLTDYFVIATGLNLRHVSALEDRVYRGLKSLGLLPMNRSGRESKNWILIDYGDVVIHLFTPEAREYYDLELLWTDAESIDLSALPPAPADV